MTITLSLSAGSSRLTLNGVSAELQSKEQVELGWKIIKAAIFSKHPEYDINKLLRSAAAN